MGLESLDSTGFRSLARPARSESLYRLSYRGPTNIFRMSSKLNTRDMWAPESSGDFEVTLLCCVAWDRGLERGSGWNRTAHRWSIYCIRGQEASELAQHPLSGYHAGVVIFDGLSWLIIFLKFFFFGPPFITQSVQCKTLSTILFYFIYWCSSMPTGMLLHQ